MVRRPNPGAERCPCPRSGLRRGELFLVRSTRYTVLRADEPYALKPLSTESGERRIGLHVVIKGPTSLGEIDLYITHLTGGGERVVLGPGRGLRRLGCGDAWAWPQPRHGRPERPGRAPGVRGLSGDRPARCVWRSGGRVDLLPCGGRGRTASPYRPHRLPMYDRWQFGSAVLFGDVPNTVNGNLVYLSDHNGSWPSSLYRPSARAASPDTHVSRRCATSPRAAGLPSPRFGSPNSDHPAPARPPRPRPATLVAGPISYECPEVVPARPEEMRVQRTLWREPARVQSPQNGWLIDEMNPISPLPSR